jgi:hypothetical protein
MTERRCPDCDRGLEQVELSLAESGRAYVEIDPQQESLIESLLGDLSGSLGDRQNRDIETVMCPSCGLRRLYADLEFEA